jgi:Fe-S cluster assembly protein SufD
MNHAEPFQDLAEALPGRHLPWLQGLRAEAEQRFAARGFPSPREEEWKYTNVVPIEKKRFRPAPPAGSIAVDPALVERFRLPNALSLVFVDGVFSIAHSSVEELPEAVTVLPLAEALERCPERVQAGLQQVAGREEHGFIDFTTAYFRDGVFVHVPAGAVLAKPVQVLHLATRGEGVSVLRHLIVLERNAEAQVVETYAGVQGGAYLTAAVTEISLGGNAGLDHYKLQLETAKAFHFGGIYAMQGSSARFRQHQAAFGGLLARTEIHTDLGQGAECELDGLFLATGRRHLDTHTRVRHGAMRGTTRETYRGIASERGRGVFAGRIVVEKDAQKTDAEMSSRNLLLSEDAEIDAKPQLEIHADDVKCAHGVTVGQLDPQAVFYLQSRGIDEASARTMLTFAFANEMVEKIRLEALQRQVQVALLEALPQADIRGDWL